MSPETIETLNDCTKATRKILTPWSILDSEVPDFAIEYGIA